MLDPNPDRFRETISSRNRQDWTSDRNDTLPSRNLRRKPTSTRNRCRPSSHLRKDASLDHSLPRLAASRSRSLQPLSSFHRRDYCKRNRSIRRLPSPVG